MSVPPNSQIGEVDAETHHWSDWAANPYPFYKTLRDHQPVFHDEEVGPHGSYLVTRYHDVSAVLRDIDRFSNIPLNLLDVDPDERISPLRMADPPRHSWLRAIVMPLFTSKEMRSREAYFKDLAEGLLDVVETKDVVEVSSQLAIPLPGRVTCDLLGLPVEEHLRFIDLTTERRELSVAQQRRLEGEGGRTIEGLREEMWAIVAPLASARRLEPRSDAISLLVRAQDKVGKEQLSDKLIVDMLLLLLTGGFHTTQHLVENFLDLMADREDLWRRLRAEPSLIAPAVEEMLRYEAPVQMLPRRARAEVEIAGTRIPANATLQMVYGSANRDERVFDDPDTFLLEREPNRHLTFSGGIHTCPGSPVTRFEVNALIKEMTVRYARIERAGPSEPWSQTGGMRGYRKVPVRLIRD